ncbi:MAG: hypothetical protein HRU23_13930 [Gammaproteobacteria bacterium]|nr:hypothetical protein [Gammaproteobacteria bacterium]
MSISETSHQAKVAYASQQTRSQTLLEIPSDDARHSSRQALIGTQKIAIEVVDFSSQFASTSSKVPANPDDTYQRPISAELLRTKILLEAIFDIKIDDDNNKLARGINQLQLSQASSSLENITGQRQLSIADLTNQGPVSITVSGQSFAPDSDILIMDTMTRTQSLNYKSSGIYQINDQVFHSTFQLQLSEQRISMTQSTISAQALKDPLLVQFGSSAIGQLNGQYSDIDINNDSTLDRLPMFNGDVGYLVFDKNNNGKADGGHELFGPQSGDGFTDLSALDSNNNGFIDREDENFSQLMLWQIDSSGQEQWRALSDTNIEAISLNSSVTPFNFYDKDDKLQAKLTQSSVAITDKGTAYGVHQVDVRI